MFVSPHLRIPRIPPFAAEEQGETPEVSILRTERLLWSEHLLSSTCSRGMCPDLSFPTPLRLVSVGQEAR